MMYWLCILFHTYICKMSFFQKNVFHFLKISWKRQWGQTNFEAITAQGDSKLTIAHYKVICF